MGDILPQVMARCGFQRQLDNNALLAAWDAAVEEILPASFRGTMQLGSLGRGTLKVRVEHATLIQELSFFESQLVGKLHELLPEKNIRHIKFVL